MSLKHGGDLIAAARRYNVPRRRWIDLSTGISPWVWPVPAVPASVWQRLPEQDGGLESAGGGYYGCAPWALLPVPGSQYAVSELARMIPKCSVALPVCGYQEHRWAWQGQAHRPVRYRSPAELETLVRSGQVRAAVAINPNNPTTLTIPKQDLEALAVRLDRRGGLLIVDEAYADVDPDNSLAGRCPMPGLVVLRSLGKYFGLAGLRLGFVLAWPEFLAGLRHRLPPWAVSTVARWVGERALLDGAWQAEQSRRLRTAAPRWQAQLGRWFPRFEFAAAGLFVTGVADRDACTECFRRLARAGILIRQFGPDEGLTAVRFGLPDEASLKEVAHRLETSPTADAAAAAEPDRPRPAVRGS